MRYYHIIALYCISLHMLYSMDQQIIYPFQSAESRHLLFMQWLQEKIARKELASSSTPQQPTVFQSAVGILYPDTLSLIYQRNIIVVSTINSTVVAPQFTIPPANSTLLSFCNRCNFVYATREELSNHMRDTHPVFCPECGKAFHPLGIAQHINQHRRYAHGNR